jgi:uncharacterized GH25 family protein
MRRFLRLAIAVLSVAGSSSVEAHDFWIEPASFRPAAGEEIGVRLRVGEKLQGDPLPCLGQQIVRFDAVEEKTAALKVALAGTDGAEPAGRWQPRAPGLYTLVYVSSGAYIELNPGKFAEYLTKEGLDAALADWRGQHEDDVPARDRYTRHAKALVAVASPAADRSAFTRPLGLELEIVPAENPLRLAPGATLTVTVLAHGKPLAGAQVVSLGEHHPDAPEILRTDAGGRVKLHLDAAGMWLLKAVRIERAAGDPLADWHSAWASLTFSLAER